MKDEKETIFDETCWFQIEALLPDDTTIKEIILDDFMWFVGRTKRYKNGMDKAEDYIHHLYLKSNPKFDTNPCVTRAFKAIDIDDIKKNILGK